MHWLNADKQYEDPCSATNNQCKQHLSQITCERKNNSTIITNDVELRVASNGALPNGETKQHKSTTATTITPTNNCQTLLTRTKEEPLTKLLLLLDQVAAILRGPAMTTTSNNAFKASQTMRTTHTCHDLSVTVQGPLGAIAKYEGQTPL